MGALLCFALLCGLAAASSGKLQSETETELTKNQGEAAGNQILVEEAVGSRVVRGSKNGKKNKKTKACEKNPKSEKCKRKKARNNNKSRQLKRNQSKKPGKG